MNERPSAGEATLWTPTDSEDVLLPGLWSVYSVLPVLQAPEMKAADPETKGDVGERVEWG